MNTKLLEKIESVINAQLTLGKLNSRDSSRSSSTITLSDSMSTTTTTTPYTTTTTTTNTTTGNSSSSNRENADTESWPGSGSQTVPRSRPRTTSLLSKHLTSKLAFRKAPSKQRPTEISGTLDPSGDNVFANGLAQGKNAHVSSDGERDSLKLTKHSKKTTEALLNHDDFKNGKIMEGDKICCVDRDVQSESSYTSYTDYEQTGLQTTQHRLDIEPEVSRAASKTPSYFRIPRIVVCVRKRPKSKAEIQRDDLDILAIPNNDHVVICEPRQRFDLTEYVENTTFRFDHCFDENATTAQVYEHTAAPMVSCIFQGYMATCFAYGQTGSGKTFTMAGPKSDTANSPQIENGIYGMVVSDLFARYKQGNYAESVTISVSFFEIYCNKVNDLLNGKQAVRVMEDSFGSIQLIGLREYQVEEVKPTLALLKHGYQQRTNGKTLANENSSRSHAIFQINIRQRIAGDSRHRNESIDSTARSQATPSGERSVANPTQSKAKPRYSGPLIGRFSLVDLAGNERSADGAVTCDRTRHMESGEINKSLLALKECIRAMGNNAASYLPFRTSKLTQVLRESFIGQRSKTCMIATVSPSLSCYEHSMNTLRYAQRVKHLQPSLLVDKRNHNCMLAEMRQTKGRDKQIGRTPGPVRRRERRSRLEVDLVERGRGMKANANRVHVRNQSRSESESSQSAIIVTAKPLTRSPSCNTYALNQPPGSDTSYFLAVSHDIVDSTDYLTALTDHEQNELKSPEPPPVPRRHCRPSVGSASLVESTNKSLVKRFTSSRPGFSRSATSSAQLKKPPVSKTSCLWRVQRQKYDVIHKHKEFVKNLPKWMAEHRRLLEKAYHDNINMLAYVDLLTYRLSKHISQLKTIQDDAMVLRCLQTQVHSL